MRGHSGALIYNRFQASPPMVHSSWKWPRLPKGVDIRTSRPPDTASVGFFARDGLAGDQELPAACSYKPGRLGSFSFVVTR